MEMSGDSTRCEEYRYTYVLTGVPVGISMELFQRDKEVVYAARFRRCSRFDDVTLATKMVKIIYSGKDHPQYFTRSFGSWLMKPMEDVNVMCYQCRGSLHEEPFHLPSAMLSKSFVDAETPPESWSSAVSTISEGLEQEDAIINKIKPKKDKPEKDDSKKAEPEEDGPIMQDKVFEVPEMVIRSEPSSAEYESAELTSPIPETAIFSEHYPNKGDIVRNMFRVMIMGMNMSTCPQAVHGHPLFAAQLPCGTTKYVDYGIAVGYLSNTMMKTTGQLVKHLTDYEHQENFAVSNMLQEMDHAAEEFQDILKQ